MAVITQTVQNDKPIVVKFAGKGAQLEDAYVWSRQLPSVEHAQLRCRFIFDPDASEYDWLVIYDDLPLQFSDGQHPTHRIDRLACPREHTLLITTEPSSIKVYGQRFLAQFGAVLTSQEHWAIRHPRPIHSQTGLLWFYGIPYSGDSSAVLDHEALSCMTPTAKDKVLSTVTSSKRMRHTFHHKRYNFVRRLKAEIPELDIFGHGIRPIADKAEGLDSYRYHIAIENHICRHHWTEKLADAFLGYTLPFYHGCPNTTDYFPADSFIPVDITDFPGTVATIRQAIENNEFEKRLPFIQQARKLVLEKYNIFAVLDREIQRMHNPAARPEDGALMMSRHALRHSSTLALAGEMLDRLRVRTHLLLSTPDNT